MIDSGMRWQECLALTGDDIVGTGILIKDSKHGKSRAIPLTTRALDAALVWAADPISEKTLRRRWFALRDIVARDNKDFVPHCLRHTCCSRLISAGVGIHVVKEFMGHDDIKTTAGYLHFDPQQLAECAKSLEKAHDASTK